MFFQIFTKNLNLKTVVPNFSKHCFCSTQSAPKKAKWKRRKDIFVEIKGDLIYGIQPVTLAVQAGRREVYSIFYNERSSRNEKIRQICQSKGIQCQQMTAFQLDSLLVQSSRYKEHTVHQGILADVSRLYHSPLDYRIPQLGIGGQEASHNLEVVEEKSEALDDLKTVDNYSEDLIDLKTVEGLSEDLDDLKTVEEHKKIDLPVWLLLCSVKDPMNLGTILRTAYFLGVDRVIVTGDRCKLSSVVSKASSGVMEIFPVFALRNPERFLGEKIEEGWDVVGTTLPGKTQELTVKEVGETKLEKPTILVMGSEGEGIPPEVMSCLNLGVYIPPGRNLHTEVDSLNVAVATSILLHSLIPPLRK